MRALFPMALAALGATTALCQEFRPPEPAGAGGQYSEDFNDRQAQGWELGRGWELVEYEPGQWGLRGSEHEFARPGGRAWRDCTIGFRLRLMRGGLHMNCRTREAQRYMVGLRPENVYLVKQTGPGAFAELAGADRPVEPNVWHEVRVTVAGGRVAVLVDGALAIEYTDPRPLGEGGISFESLDETEAFIDDVAVVGVEGEERPGQERRGEEEPETERPGTGPPRGTPGRGTVALDPGPGVGGPVTLAAAVLEMALPEGPVATPVQMMTAYLVPMGSPGFTWVPTGGPLGGLGYDLRMRPDRPNTMYVTDNWMGACISKNSGQTWAPCNGTGAGKSITARTGRTGEAIPVFSLTIDPHNHDILWAGTKDQRGIFKSTDAGKTWTEMDNGVLEKQWISFRGFTVDPRTSEIVYAAAELSSQAWFGKKKGGQSLDLVKGVVYKTINGGLEWGEVWRGDNLARYVIIDPRNPDVIYISTGIFDREAGNSTPGSVPGGVGVQKSVDGGKTWQSMNVGLQNLYIGSLFMHPKNPDILLAGAGCNPYRPGSGVYITTNGGKEWIKTLNTDVITSVEFSSSNPKIAYAGGAHAVFRSDDGGFNWKQMTPVPNTWGPPGIRAGWPIDFQVHPRNLNRIYANNYGGGAFLSMDGGKTWKDSSNGYTGSQVRRLVVDQKNALRVFAAGRSGLFRTDNGGGKWNGLQYPPAIELDWNALALDPQNSNHVLAGTNWGVAQMCESHDAGKSWAQVGALNTPNMGWRCLAFAPSNPKRIYAGTGAFKTASQYDDDWPARGIWAWDDVAKKWSETNDSVSKQSQVADLAIHPQYPMLVYAATTTDGVLKTTNGGASWQKSNAGISQSPPRVYSVAINPKAAGIIYCGLKFGGLYRSTDAGATWKQAANGLDPNSWISDIVFDPTNPQVMYASDLLSGVYRSSDGGKSWKQVNAGLRIRSINALAISSNGRTLYAGSEGNGVYRMAVPAP